MSSSDLIGLLVIAAVLFFLIRAMFRKTRKPDNSGADTSHNSFWGDGGGFDGGDGGGD